MTGTEHKDPASKWLIFFFVCFGIVLLGIVIFFARDVNKEEPPKAVPAHGGMILPGDGNYAPHIYIHRAV